MEWTYENTPVTDEMTEGYVGFVYVITNSMNGRKYIGKKKLTKKQTRKPLKGQKRKRVTISASDWRDYYGSNEELQEDVSKHGTENFKREILRFCKTLGECSYFEAKYQFETDAIINEEFYNVWLSVRVRASHLKGVEPCRPKILKLSPT